MEWMASVIRRMGRLLDRRRLDEELEDELAAHVALKKQHLEREGCSWAEAERQARMALGNATAWRETTRERMQCSAHGCCAGTRYLPRLRW